MKVIEFNIEELASYFDMEISGDTGLAEEVVRQNLIDHLRNELVFLSDMFDEFEIVKK